MHLCGEIFLLSVFNFLRIHVLQLKVTFRSYFQCEITLIHIIRHHIRLLFCFHNLFFFFFCLARVPVIPEITLRTDNLRKVYFDAIYDDINGILLYCSVLVGKRLFF